MLCQIQSGCEKHKTHPDLQRLLLTSMREWMVEAPDDIPYSPTSADYPPTFERLIQQQTAIGWRQIINGRFSKQWAALQEEHYVRMATQQRNRKTTGTQWLTNIIGEIWAAHCLLNRPLIICRQPIAVCC